MIPPSSVIVALDSQDESFLQKLLLDLKGSGVWVKVGMELFYAHGPKFIYEAKKHNLKVFLDLKLHDIPNTVGQGIKSLLQHPIDMVNIHAAGGTEMMKRAADTVKASSHPPLLIAVTQLTSTSEIQMNDEQRIQGGLLQSVLHFSKLAQASGCDGVVSSPLEVSAIKESCGTNFITVTPGIRPKGAETQDQKRITTPMDAHKLGTDFMVIGRPITADKDPKAALQRILKGE